MTFGALLALAAVVLGVAAVWSQRRAERVNAVRLALEGQLSRAEPVLLAVLKRHPEDVAVLRALALGRLNQGELAGVEDPLNRWCALRPDDPEPHLTRVTLALQRDLIPEAIEAAQTALALQPDNRELRERLAHWLYRVGRTAEAEAEIRRCRERRPDDPWLRLLHAEICHRLGDNSKAEELVVGLLRDQPNYPPALVLRGILYLDAEQPEQAIPPLKQALTLVPSGPLPARVRHYLSLALARTGQEEQARQLVGELQQQQALELWEKYGRSESVGYKLRLAEAYLATGQWQDAVRQLEVILAQDPACAAAHRLLADHYEAHGQTAKAAEHRRKAGE